MDYSQEKTIHGRNFGKGKKVFEPLLLSKLIIKEIFSLKLINEACLTKGLREKSKNLIDLIKPK